MAGGASGNGESIRTMASGNQIRAHQHQGNACNLENSDTFRTQNHEQKSDDSHRQHILCELFKPSRRNQVTETTGNNCTNSDLVPGQRNLYQSQTYSRSVQCNFRQTVTVRTDCDHRMVNAPICNPPNSSDLGNANDRPFCHQLQSQSSNILQPNSGPECSSCGRHGTELDQHASLCLPSTSNSSPSSPKNKTGTLHCIPNSSSMAVKVMVSSIAQSTDRPPQTDNTQKKAAKTTLQQHLPSKSQCSPTSRLATIRQHLKKQGFSQKSANSITKRCRPSTNKLYEAKWRVFTSWCGKRKIDPLKISKQQLANFFAFLHDDLHKGHSAILGYKAVINSTIKLCKSKDVCNNYHLESLLRSYKLEKPATDKSTPKWNLNLVLNSLTKKPYEPMLSASLKHLTWKTTFLLSFATASRVSELTALSRKKVAHDRHWTKVSLQTSDSFVAKNQDLTIEPEPRKYTVPALYDFAGPDLPDRYLCPVRSLRYYLHKTDYIRTPEKKALLISHSPNHKGDITSNTVANWIKNVIKLAYHNAQQDDLKIAKVTAHEVRSLAASTAFSQNLSFQNINQACYWRGHSTFTNFYLRDLAMEQNHELQMPNVVAAATKVIRKK